MANAGHIIEELHRYTYETWLRKGRVGATTEELRTFLATLMLDIDSVIRLAEKGGLIMQVPNKDCWLPRPRNPATYKAKQMC